MIPNEANIHKRQGEEQDLFKTELNLKQESFSILIQ